MGNLLAGPGDGQACQRLGRAQPPVQPGRRGRGGTAESARGTGRVHHQGGELGGGRRLPEGFLPRRVVFAILRKGHDALTVDTLCPFAQVALAHAARTLRSYGVQVEVVCILRERTTRAGQQAARSARGGSGSRRPTQRPRSSTRAHGLTYPIDAALFRRPPTVRPGRDPHLSRPPTARQATTLTSAEDDMRQLRGDRVVIAAELPTGAPAPRRQPAGRAPLGQRMGQRMGSATRCVRGGRRPV